MYLHFYLDKVLFVLHKFWHYLTKFTLIYCLVLPFKHAISIFIIFVEYAMKSVVLSTVYGVIGLNGQAVPKHAKKVCQATILQVSYF